MARVTKSNGLVSLSVNGTSYGVWDTRSGGDISSSESRYRPGGGGEQVDPGRPTVADVTITKAYDPTTGLREAMEGFIGTAAVAVVTDTPTDATGAPIAKPETWTGIVKSAQFDDTDSASDDRKIATVVIAVQKKA